MGTDELLTEALHLAFLQRFRFHNNRFQEVPSGTQAPAGRPRPLHKTAWRSVGRQVMALHDAYTGSGGEFAHERNPLHRYQAGYQFYFLPRNVFRIQHVLQELPWLDGAGLSGLLHGDPAQREGILNVLDLGCGTGAFSLSIIALIAERAGPDIKHARFVLVDQGKSLLELALANVKAFSSLALAGVKVEVEMRQEGVEAYLATESRRGQFGIVGGGMMLNEMALLGSRRTSKRAVRFITPLMRLPRKGGLIAFVEPGTRKGYMNLMALRDQIKGNPILYPCPHDKPCPIWNPKVNRWCHSTRPLPAGFGFDRELREHGGIGFAMRELNLTGLALQFSPAGKVLPPFYRARGSRVVSNALPARGPKTRGQGGKTGKELSSLPPVVLQCGENGALKEIPAGPVGAHPRGKWLARKALGAGGGR